MIRDVFVVTLISVLLCIPSITCADGPVLKLTVSDEKVNVGDPLLVAVDFVNHGAEDVYLRGNLTQDRGLLVYTRHESHAEPTLVDDPAHTHEGLWGEPGLKVEPGKSYHGYEVLFISRPRDRFVFSLPGKYELTARLRTSVWVVESQPMRVEVADISDRHWDRLDANRQLLKELISFPYVPAKEDQKKLGELAARFPPDSLARFLEAESLIVAIGDHPQEFDPRLKRLMQHTKDNQVWERLSRIKAGYLLVEKEEFALARRVAAEELKIASDVTERLRLMIEDGEQLQAREKEFNEQ